MFEKSLTIPYDIKQITRIYKPIFEFNHNKNQWTQKDPSIEPSIDKEEKSRVPPDTRAYHKMVKI